MSSKVLIKGASLWTSDGFVHERDLVAHEGRLIRIGEGLAERGAAVLPASGWLVLPGFVDLHAHLGEPGRDDRESLESGLKAAAWGGFTQVVAMPDTDPPVDDEPGVEYVHAKGARAQGARVSVCSAVTKARAGKELAELAALTRAGAVAVGDAAPVANAAIMRRALEYTRMLGVPVFSEACDRELAAGGVAHEGEVGGWLGLAGIPASAEWVALARDLLLAESTGGRLHVQGVSTERSIELIRRAKARGARVSAECSFHHLLFSDEDLRDYDTAKKLSPPLRPPTDILALVEGVASGVLDCIVTDHTPATPEEKNTEFDEAAFGAAGFEVALAAIHTHLVESGALTWNDVVEAVSRRPRVVLGLAPSALEEGAVCDMTLFNPAADIVVDPREWHSRARNTPLEGQRLRGRVEGVFIGDQIYGPCRTEVR